MKSTSNVCRRKKIARTMLVCLMALSLVTGLGVTDDSVYAASSPYVSGSFTHKYANHVIVNGIDISDWQNTPDMSGAKASGIDYAIIRVTYTSYGKKNLKTNIDEDFVAHYRNAKAAGIMTGAYVFSQAKNASEGAAEANAAIARLRSLGIGPADMQLPVYMDYEFAGGIFGRLYGLKKADATAAALAFCNTIRAAGYTPGIYASTTFFNKYLTLGQFASDVDLWCAQYYKKCELGANYSKWQYSSSASISGFSGRIDADFWYLNPSADCSPGVTVNGGGGSYDYTGGPIQPAVTVTDSSGNTLRAGVDYQLGYINNVAPGTAYIYVKGMGSYSGYKLTSFNITGGQVYVPKTKIKTLKGKKKKFYIKVAKKKKSKVTGYQVRYSRNKDMSESVTKKIGKKYNKVSKNIKTNARKRYYYVQVRSYKDQNGIRSYSAWSAVKRVKVK